MKKKLGFQGVSLFQPRLVVSAFFPLSTKYLHAMREGFGRWRSTRTREKADDRARVHRRIDNHDQGFELSH